MEIILERNMTICKSITENNKVCGLYFLIIIIFLRINFPLNRDLAVNEEFDCPTIEDPKSANPLNYRKSTDPV